MTFRDVVMHCAADLEFVAQFDRLTRSNMSRSGSGLDLMIDDATGRPKKDAEAFIAFVLDVVWLRLPNIQTNEASP